jgi:hypothetical protein
MIPLGKNLFGKNFSVIPKDSSDMFIVAGKKYHLASRLL